MPSGGDVERFAYCPRNWYLAGLGVDSGGHDGELKHAALGKDQAAVESQKEGYRSAMRWSFRVLAMAASATILALELLFLRAHPQHLVFLVTALVMVSASSGLLVIALERQARYKRGQLDAGLVPGKLMDTDLIGTAQMLEDPEWGLAGRPDYVLQTKDGPVPVEVKTGRTPDAVFHSHALQVACYLRLLDAHGTTPPYGLVQYPEGVFRVPWDDAMQADLKRTLDRMASGEKDRDHQHAARCRGCARRKACDQRLA